MLYTKYIHKKHVHATVIFCLFTFTKSLVFIEFGMTFIIVETILSYTLISYNQL
jgi:hypothetical protein